MASIVSCDGCESETVGSTLFGAFFAQAPKHIGACNKNASPGYTYSTLEGEIKYSGQLDKQGVEIVA